MKIMTSEFYLIWLDLARHLLLSGFFEEIATAEAKKKTSNNQFGIDNQDLSGRLPSSEVFSNQATYENP